MRRAKSTSQQPGDDRGSEVPSFGMAALLGRGICEVMAHPILQGLCMRLPCTVVTVSPILQGTFWRYLFFKRKRKG